MGIIMTSPAGKIPAWMEVSDATGAAGVSSVDVTGLDLNGDTGGLYRLFVTGEVTTAGNTSSINVNFNGDAGAHYYTSSSQWNNTAATVNGQASMQIPYQMDADTGFMIDFIFGISTDSGIAVGNGIVTSLGTGTANKSMTFGIASTTALTGLGNITRVHIDFNGQTVDKPRAILTKLVK
jgi:hypothetical protein